MALKQRVPLVIFLGICVLLCCLTLLRQSEFGVENAQHVDGASHVSKLEDPNAGIATEKPTGSTQPKEDSTIVAKSDMGASTLASRDAEVAKPRGASNKVRDAL